MRLCVVLAYHEGMTHEEIATLSEMPLGTVKSNIARGSARLREFLAGYGVRDREDCYAK
jgi:RNA polymerase sigma-70 factor (ECF subfamily)